MANDTDEPGWTEVIVVCIQPDTEEGGYRATIYNAREEELEALRPYAVGERGALLEVSNDLKGRGYEGHGRWRPDGYVDTGALVRSFRRTGTATRA